MSRKKIVNQSKLVTDKLVIEQLVTKMINILMQDGKKTIAENICFKAFSIVQEITQRQPIVVFEEALHNIMPFLEVRSRRIGGQKYQIPSEVRPERRQSLALRWLVQYAQKQRHEKTMQHKLAKEIIDAAAGNGLAVKRKEEIHAMAESNKAFAHYRW